MMLINSRFKIIRSLGSGRSDVFEVNDIIYNNRRYALKIISSENITPFDFESLKEEFKLLRSLKHPNIVKAIEIGKVYESDNESLINSFFYTSELLQGQNLFFLRELIREENFLNILYDLLNQICTTLYYIHQLNIIHFDIRPENILMIKVKPEKYTIKLIDFGFSALKKQSIKGTPLYISPELISGASVDYRADLYSLGASLYHVLVGYPPFESDNEIELLKKHLEEYPPNLPENFPDNLNFIVQKLLSKNPAERFNNALEILNYLPEEFRQIQNHWPLPKIYFARKEEFKLLKQFVENRNADSKTTCLILSERGMGKSFLLDKFKSFIEETELSYLHLNVAEQQPQSYNLLHSLLLQIEQLIKIKNLRLDSVLSRNIELLKSLYDRHEIKSDFLENQKSYLSEILIGIAKTTKFFFLIDDLQLLDKATSEFIYYIYPSLIELGIKFIFTVDVSFIKSNDYEKLQRTEEIILVPLTRDQISEMLHTHFNFDFPYEEVTELIINHTDGSNNQINNFINNLFFTGILKYDHRGFQIDYQKFSDHDLSKIFSQTHKNKFDNLPDFQKQILKILSLLDFPLKLTDLSNFLRGDTDHLKEEIIFLSSIGWIEFSLIDENVFLPMGGMKNYISVLAKEDKDLNLQLARYFEFQSYPSFLVAPFYEFGGEINKALDYYLKSVQETENFFSFSIMEKYLLKCIDLEEEPSRKNELKHKLVQCYFNLSEFQNAEALALELLEDKSFNYNVFDLFITLAKIKFRSGDVDAAYEYLDQAYKHATTDQQKIEIEINQINLDVNQGNFSIADKKCKMLLNEYSEILNPIAKAAILNNLGITNSQAGFFNDAIPYFAEAIKIYDQNNNKIKSAQTLLNLGNVYNLLGEKKEALNYWNKALQLNDSIGDLSRKATILNNIGISFFEELKFDEAINYYLEAKNIFEKNNDLAGKNLAIFNLAESHFMMCNYDKALNFVEEAIELSNRLIDIEGQCQSRFLLGLLFFALYNLDNLEKLINELLQIIEINKIQTTQLQNYLYLSGLLNLEIKNYDEAEIKINLAREMYKSTKNKYFYCKSTIDLMWLYFYSGKYDFILNLFDELNSYDYFNFNNSLKAEALLILGDSSKRPGSNFTKSAIEYYSESLSLIENSYINETTWQVLTALGEELLVKGAVKKGIEYIRQAKLVIDYLANQISKNYYKNLYLAHPKRQRTISKIEKVLNNY